MEKLKPCPFCGSKAHIEKGFVRFRRNKANKIRKAKTIAYFIGCSDSECILYASKRTSSLFFTVSKDGLDVMIRKWNRRVGEPYPALGEYEGGQDE